MGRTACTEPQCLYKGALYLTFLQWTGWLWKCSMIPSRGKRVSLLHSVQTSSGASQAHIQWVPVALSPVVNWQWHVTDHLPESGAEIKNA